MTMSSQHAYQFVADSGIIAGFRGAFPADIALKTCSILLEEEINCFEFTMNSQDPIEAMQAVKVEFGDDVCVGMGTVLDVATAEQVMDAGADFVVSPAFQPNVVQVVLDRDLLMAPGITTPSEAVAAWSMGVKLLKFFPVGALGIDYFKAVYGPLNHIKFMCNGAMNDENAREFIQAGATAAGMGGWLTGDGTWTDSRLRSRARILVNAIASGREN
ncbi:MAG: bifunctional 4-hydroxy-2-oxoglutarate aldolase/2-dehydro-3-deoxy-phosphogluconate aldolase [Phototrophicaceae bacterium]